MSTILIELTNEKALGLIEELESLNLVKILQKENVSKPKLSDKYAGKLSNGTADLLRKHVDQIRNKWEQDSSNLFKELEKMRNLFLAHLKDLYFVQKPIEEKEQIPKRQWGGSISKESATKMLEHADQIRQEWDRDI